MTYRLESAIVDEVTDIVYLTFTEKNDTRTKVVISKYYTEIYHKIKELKTKELTKEQIKALI